MQYYYTFVMGMRSMTVGSGVDESMKVRQVQAINLSSDLDRCVGSFCAHKVLAVVSEVSEERALNAVMTSQVSNLKIT
jgi:hypothetical protein